MKVLISLLAGIGMGALVMFWIADQDDNSSRSGATTHHTEGAERVIVEETDPGEDPRIAELEAEVRRLRGILADMNISADPEPEYSLEDVEAILLGAFEDTSIESLMEAIRRLLAMGERGYPRLKLLLEQLASGRFRPSAADFRIDQIYTLTHIGARYEKQIVGFLDYLLRHDNTQPIMRQVATMVAAYFVGSGAAGSDALKETLMQSLLGSEGGLAGSMFGNMGRRMQLFAMAMSGDPKVIPALHDELERTRNPRQQGEIIQALAYLGDPRTVDLVKERLDPREGDFGRELEALARVGTPEAAEAAATFLKGVDDSKRFFRHARRYARGGGGDEAVALISERIRANPADPEVARTVGLLRRMPTKQSRDTLVFIRDSSPDEKVRQSATSAVESVERALSGQPPVAPKR